MEETPRAGGRALGIISGAKDQGNLYSHPNRFPARDLGLKPYSKMPLSPALKGRAIELNNYLHDKVVRCTMSCRNGNIKINRSQLPEKVNLARNHEQYSLIDQ